MRRKTHFSLRLLGLVTVLLIGTVTWTGCQGCEIQPGMSPEGWCCDGGNVSPCSEDECHSWGGAFFLHEHEAIAHCQGSASGPSPPGKPVINYFTATPNPVSPTGTVTLAWEVSGANKVTLDGVMVAYQSKGAVITTRGMPIEVKAIGSRQDDFLVHPVQWGIPHPYKLTAQNATGAVTKEVTVTVTP